MSGPPRTPWWKGARGEWYVVVQLALFALIAVGPRSAPGWPEWTFPPRRVAAFAGATLLALGASLVLGGSSWLGRSLTPLPAPNEWAALRQDGPYRFVRHPIYCGGVLMALGWSLWVRGWLTLAFALALFVLVDLKARREERWLMEKFPEYAGYRKRVRRLIPFVY